MSGLRYFGASDFALRASTGQDDPATRQAEVGCLMSDVGLQRAEDR